MSVGLVYLRPKQVTCTRAAGNGSAAATEAWHRMRDWLQCNAVAALVTTRYGLQFRAGQDAGFYGDTYVACVEIGSVPTLPPLHDCQIDRLPGGAFVRRRFVGPCAEIATAFTSIHAELGGTDHYSEDRSRPCITVFLDAPDFSLSTPVKTDLLVPVATLRQAAA